MHLILGMVGKCDLGGTWEEQYKCSFTCDFEKGELWVRLPGAVLTVRRVLGNVSTELSHSVRRVNGVRRTAALD